MTQLRHAFRQLCLRPGMSAVVIAMLAVGIGATTAIFAMFHEVLVQPLSVPEPERLVNFVRAGSGQGFSYPMVRDFEADVRNTAPEQRVLAGVAAHWQFTANVARDDLAVSLLATYVSGDYFSVLRLQPSRGRLIGPEDVARGGESAVVVLSHDLWVSRFASDPDIVGKALSINGQPLTVVGVGPRGFSGTQLGNRSQLFVPLSMRWVLETLSGPAASPENRNFTFLQMAARLAPGVSIEQATAAVNTLHARIVRELEAPLRGLSVEALPQFIRAPLELAPGARGQGAIAGAAPSLTLLLGLTALVLLIVCVNVANLFLVRGSARAGEMAIRESMGASRAQLVAQLFAEAALPAAIGGVLAVFVAAATLAAVTPILPMRLAEGFALDIGWRAASFAALMTIGTTVAFGLFPALRTARIGTAVALKGHAPQAVGGRGAARLRAVLGTAQIAFSMVLLVLAGLFAQSLRNVARIDLGIDVDSLASFSVAPERNGYTAERAALLHDEIGRALSAQPAVVGVTTAAWPVLAGRAFRVDVRDGDDGPNGMPVDFNVVAPGFFATLGIPLLAGRDFSAADTADSPPVTIVSERFARQYGRGSDVLGTRLRAGPDSYEIVGIVANAAAGSVKAGDLAQFFVPLGGNHSFAVASDLMYYVRTSLEPDALLTAIPRTVAEVDPTVPVDNLMTLRRQARETVFVDRFVTILSLSFAGLATLLAAIGLYGVMAYNVAQRKRELGLRLALGAEPANLRAMVLKQVGTMTLLGIAIGLIVAVASGRTVEALLFGLSSRSPSVLVGAAALLAVVVLAASYWPARRASNIAPLEALRHE
jgi:putative ABC transport system permease protein